MSETKLQASYILASGVKAGSIHIPKNKTNITYKDFNKDGNVWNNEVYAVDIKRNSIFNRKIANLTETWVDQDGDGRSDWYIKEYREPNTGEILSREKYKASYDKNAPLENDPCYMARIVKKSDEDWYKNPQKYEQN